MKKVIVVLAHAFVGWALCGATMGIGLARTSVENAQVIHAVGAPLFFAIVSWFYFRKFGYTTPAQTAIIFVGFVVVVDFFVVALLILGSFEMFASALGTWIPFALIAAATYLMGLYCQRRIQNPV